MSAQLAIPSAPAASGSTFPPRSIWWWASLFAASYCIGAGFSGYFSFWTLAVSYFWLPSGLYLGALLLSAPRHWPLLIAAAWAGDLAFNFIYFTGPNWKLSMLVASHTGNTASAVVGAWLVRRLLGPRPAINSVKDLFCVILAGGAVALVITAAVGAWIIDSWQPEVSFTSNWISWYASDLLGVLLITPAMLVWARPGPAPAATWRRRRVVPEAILLFSGLLAATVLSFSFRWPQRTETLYVAFPFVIWAAVRFGRRGASIAILLAAIIAHWFTAFGFGAIGASELSIAQKSIEMLASIGVFAVVGLVPAVALSAQRRAEARSHESEERFERAIRGSSAGLWDWEVATGEVFYSPRYKQLLGYDYTEFADTLQAFFEALHPDDVPVVRAAHAEHFAHAGSNYDVDYRLRTRGGDYRWFNSRGEAQRDEAGNVVRMSGSILDIEERKQLESQLQQAGKLEVIGQLAGGVAHDFNNILAAMIMNLELLQLEPGRPREEAESLAELHRLAKRAARLTEQMLMFARRRHIDLTPVDLRVSLQELTELLRRLLPETVELRHEPHPAPLGVCADTAMIDQVVINLCLNASDAMPRGGTITLRELLLDISAEDAAATVGARAGQVACIEVADTGLGMSPDVLSRIFEPFFTTKAPGKGTGLGLASAHGIVAQHEGWMTVSSEEGRGTRFRVHLPLIDTPLPAPISATTPAAAAYPAAPTARHVLLVEDDAAVREATTRAITLLGHRVLAARNAPEARSLVEKPDAPIDLLFTDTVMPGGTSGLELARELRARLPGLRVVLTSGYSDAILHGESLHEDGMLFLAKPYSHTDLTAVFAALWPDDPA